MIEKIKNRSVLEIIGLIVSLGIIVKTIFWLTTQALYGWSNPN